MTLLSIFDTVERPLGPGRCFKRYKQLAASVGAALYTRSAHTGIGKPGLVEAISAMGQFGVVFQRRRAADGEMCIRDCYRIESVVFEVTQRQEGKIAMEDHDIRAALDRHWAASDANDFEAEHQIYREDAVIEYPQSAERIRGRRNIQASRFAQPSRKRFTVRRILGAGGLWITEFVITYDARPSYTVSIMEFSDGKVAARPNTSATRLSRGLRALNGSSGCAET